jgi:hypothetical protein
MLFVTVQRQFRVGTLFFESAKLFLSQAKQHHVVLLGLLGQSYAGSIG